MVASFSCPTSLSLRERRTPPRLFHIRTLRFSLSFGRPLEESSSLSFRDLNAAPLETIRKKKEGGRRTALKIQKSLFVVHFGTLESSSHWTKVRIDA